MRLSTDESLFRKTTKFYLRNLQLLVAQTTDHIKQMIRLHNRLGISKAQAKTEIEVSGNNILRTWKKFRKKMTALKVQEVKEEEEISSSLSYLR